MEAVRQKSRYNQLSLYQIREIEIYLLSQSLDNLGTTQDECLGRTRWSSPLDLATYLYYFTSGCVPIII